MTARMGVIDQAILEQLKKAQGETNKRLDRIADLLERLLEQPAR